MSDQLHFSPVPESHEQISLLLLRCEIMASGNIFSNTSVQSLYFLVVVRESWWASCCAYKKARLLMILVVLHSHNWVAVGSFSFCSPNLATFSLTAGTAAVWDSHFSLFCCVFSIKEVMKEVLHLPTFSLWHLSVAWFCCHTSVLLLLNTVQTKYLLYLFISNFLSFLLSFGNSLNTQQPLFKSLQDLKSCLKSLLLFLSGNRLSTPLVIPLLVWRFSN